MRLSLRKIKEWRFKRHVKKFGSKNNGFFNHFNEDWFDKHQGILLWLLNHKILKYWARWILRIQKDCKFSEYIDKIKPHTYRIKIGENIYRSDFRTHQKFSKRIYYAFRPIWWMLHILDLFLDKFGRWVQEEVEWVYDVSDNPKDWIAGQLNNGLLYKERKIRWQPFFSFGFDTLVAYPAVGDTTGWDGYVGYDGNSESYTTVRNAANGTHYGAISTTPQIGNTINAGNYYVYRGYLMFLCTVIGEGTINNATLSFHASNKEEADTGQGKLHVVSTTIGQISYIQASDYSKIGSISFSNIANASISTSDYNNLILNSNGISNIDKTSSWSKFGFRLDGDLNNNAPISGGNRVYWRAVDIAGATQDPKLTVEYTLPVTSAPLHHGKPGLSGKAHGRKGL